MHRSPRPLRRGAQDRPPWVPWLPLVVAAVALLLMDNPSGAPGPTLTLGPAATVGDPVHAGVPPGPIFRMPFPAGQVVLCAQGNASLPGRTHALPQNRYALDFSARSEDAVVVVGAAAGRVAYVYRESGSDPNDGAGYGNQVKIDHGGGLHTLYAHLDQVDVEPGEMVGTGERLGTMGFTGLAGDRHLHLSLHQGSTEGAGAVDSVPFPGIVAVEIGGAEAFTPVAGVEFSASSPRSPWDGCLYGSENDGSTEPWLGPPRPELARALATASAAMLDSVERRQALWEFASRNWRIDPDHARAELEPLLDSDPSDPVAIYYFAADVELPREAWPAARRALHAARVGAALPRFREPWLLAWIENKLGVVAYHERRYSAARQHFDRAAELLPMEAVIRYGERYLEQIR